MKINKEYRKILEGGEVSERYLFKSLYRSQHESAKVVFICAFLVGFIALVAIMLQITVGGLK